MLKSFVTSKNIFPTIPCLEKSAGETSIFIAIKEIGLFSRTMSLSFCPYYLLLVLEVPLLVGKLVAIIHGEFDDIQVVKDPSHFANVFLSQQHLKKKLVGLIFDQTNFCSPCGGQACDTGDIKSATNQVGGCVRY